MLITHIHTDTHAYRPQSRKMHSNAESSITKFKSFPSHNAQYLELFKRKPSIYLFDFAQSIAVEPYSSVSIKLFTRIFPKISKR